MQCDCPAQTLFICHYLLRVHSSYPFILCLLNWSRLLKCDRVHIEPAATIKRVIVTPAIYLHADCMCMYLSSLWHSEHWAEITMPKVDMYWLFDPARPCMHPFRHSRIKKVDHRQPSIKQLFSWIKYILSMHAESELHTIYYTSRHRDAGRRGFFSYQASIYQHFNSIFSLRY